MPKKVVSKKMLQNLRWLGILIATSGPISCAVVWKMGYAKFGFQTLFEYASLLVVLPGMAILLAAVGIHAVLVASRRLKIGDFAPDDTESPSRPT